MRVAASEELMRSGSDGLVASLRGQRSVNRILSIGGGTHEIMNEVIAKQLGL